LSGINNYSKNEKDLIGQDIYRLLVFYRELTYLLETFFSGYLLIPNDEINRNYLRLCNKVSDILVKPFFQGLSKEDWKPFTNLRTFDPDAPDVEWDYHGSRICGNFLSAIEDIYIAGGEKKYPLSDDDKQLLSSINSFLEKYKDFKKQYENKYLQQVESQINKQNKHIGKTELAELDFGFIRDQEIKDLLVRDLDEAQKAFNNQLFKSTVLLCGTILESILIDTLSSVEKESKFKYYQKYIEGKEKERKPPDIEYWKFYEIIEIAKHMGIISNDTAKISHIIKDYRNLIHLHVQKRDKLKIDSHVVSAVLHLLAITYNDVANWHNERSVKN